MNVIKANEVNVLNLGRQGEHLRTAIEFDYSDLAKEFPGGAAVLRVRMPDAEETYIEANVEYDFDKNSFVWTVTEHDTAYEGIGSCQMIYSWEGRAKSKVWKTYTGENVMHSEIAPPEWEDLIDMLSDLAAETVANADRAYHSAQDAENSAEEAAGYAEDAENQAKEAASSANFVKKAELSIIQKHAEVATMHREVQSNRDATDANRELAELASESASASATYVSEAAEQVRQNASAAMTSANTANQDANRASQYATNAESAKNTAVSSAQAVEQMQAQINQTADAVNANKVATDGYKDQAEASANSARNDAELASEVRRKYETMNVEAQTRDAGSPADVTYVPATNTTIFGIPKGDKGDPSVTKETIHNALGFDPADQEEVSQIKGDMSDLNIEFNKAEKDISDMFSLVEETKADKASLAKTNRSLDALWKISEGQTYSVEEKVETGMNVAPSGAEFMSMDEVHGKSEQESTNGYQLIPYPYKNPSGTNNGVKFVFLNDGRSHISGTPISGNASYDIVPISADAKYKPIASSPTATFSAIGLEEGVKVIASGASGFNGFPYTELTNTQPSKTSEITDATKPLNYITLRVMAGYTVDCVVGVMFEQGSVVHDWEPYTGGIPSPNPEFPQGIHSVKEINITKYGRNLCIRNEGETSNIYNAHNLIPCKIGDTFYVYGEWDGSTSNNMRADIFANANETNKNNAIGMSATLTSGDVKAITVSRDGYFGVCYSAGIQTYTVRKMMVSKHPFTAEEYEDYRKDEYTITPPRPLNKIGDYVDKADVKRGVWEYNTEKYNLSSFNWSYNATAKAFYNSYFYLKPYSPYYGAIASNYVVSRWNSSSSQLANASDKTAYVQSNGNLFVKNEEIADVADFVNSLENHYMIIAKENETSTEPMNENEIAVLRSLENTPADHHIIVTDQDGNDVSYLLQYIIKLSEVN